jgi:asparagine synthase (glutamine-hydrolysing)
LRDFALEIGVPKESALRKKTAAQYGSGFDKTLAKIAKPLSKTQYLKSFYNIGAMLSSGKDGMFATHKMQQEGYNIAGIISIQSKNPYSYMFHTPNVELVKLQAKSMKLPLITQNTVGKKEKELKDLEKVLKKAKKKFNLQGIVTGALFSEYQKDRIEKICNKLNLKSFSPLWHMDQEKEMRELLKNFEIIFSSIAAYGLDKSWVGRKITEKDVDKLVKLHKKYQINIAGEGGEFESLVLNCPMFSKKIKIINSKIIEEDENNAKLIIKKAKLI